LSNRTVTISLPPIAALRPEASLWPEFETLRPGLLATLATAVATAMSRIREVDIGNVARFADCATWAAAAAPALGLQQEQIIDAFTSRSCIWAASDPLGDAIHALLRENGGWIGSATQLLSRLATIVPRRALPATPKGLSQALRRIAGIIVVRQRDSEGERILTITPAADVSAKSAKN